jgi:hypothetical protein
LVSFFVGGDIGSAVLVVAGMTLGATVQSVGSLLGLIAGTYFFHKLVFERTQQKLARDQIYRDKLQHWESEWFCSQCGYRWEPKDSSTLTLTE